MTKFFAAVFALSVCSAAMAAPPPPPKGEPTISPSRVVGNSHDCSTYYPDLARRLNESGDVLVGYDVGADGAISNVRLAKSSGSDRLDMAALACVREAWRNTPATKNGVPIASPGHQALIRFSIADALPAEQYLRQGVNLDSMGRHADALAQFAQALFIDPNYAAAYRARAKAYAALGQADFAKGDNDRADLLEKGH